MELNVESYPLLVSFTPCAWFICGDISTKKEKKGNHRTGPPQGTADPLYQVRVREGGN